MESEQTIQTFVRRANNRTCGDKFLSTTDFLSVKYLKNVTHFLISTFNNTGGMFALRFKVYLSKCQCVGKLAR